MEIKTFRGAVYDRCGNPAAFAKASGIPLSRVYRLIRGKMKPRIDEIARIARCLDMPIPMIVFLYSNASNHTDDIGEAL